MLLVVVVLAAVVVGAAAQRVAGLGYALVTAPVMALALGPVGGVLVVNVSAVLTSSLVLARVRHDVDRRRFLLLGSCAVAGALPGSWLAQTAPSAWLELVVGVLVLLGLAASVLARRAPAVRGRGPAVVAGVAAGVMNATAGVGGPAFGVYAVASRWPQRSFAATLQPLFLTTGLVAFVTKVAIDPTSLPSLPWWAWAAGAVLLLGGVGLGELLSRRVSQARARVVLLALATTGATAITVRGAAGLLGG